MKGRTSSAPPRRLLSSLVGAMCVVSCGLLGCKSDSKHDCRKLVRRYWRAVDIDPYFSALRLDEAAKRCEKLPDDLRKCVATSPTSEIGKCEGVDQVPIDRGWEHGFYCLPVEGDRWSRCERSNRECEYYRRRLGSIEGNEVGRCRPSNTAWVIEVDSVLHNPTPSRETCTEMRAELAKLGKVVADVPCVELTYEQLRARQPRQVVSPGGP